MGISGAIFSFGLVFSGMARMSKVYGFFNVFSNNWDPTLLIVLGSAIIVNIFTFRFILIPFVPRLQRFQLLLQYFLLEDEHFQ